MNAESHIALIIGSSYTPSACLLPEPDFASKGFLFHSEKAWVMCLRAGDSAPCGTLMLHSSKRPPQAARSCGEEKMFVRNSRLSPIPPRGGAAQTAALHGKPNWATRFTQRLKTIEGEGPSSRLPILRPEGEAEPDRNERKRLSLALQGGGAFGAFTWGVLDRLLEEEDIAFDAISGASAGAINAVLLASGLARGGR